MSRASAGNLVNDRRLSVGHLVHSLYREGGLFDRRASPLTPLAGLRAQQRYQAGRSGPYETEVRLGAQFPFGALSLHLSGRADGLARGPQGWCLEEVKSYGFSLEEAQAEQGLHRAQLLCYGALLALQEPATPDPLCLCLTYLHEATGRLDQVRWDAPLATLKAFLQESLQAYVATLAGEGARLEARNQALVSLPFPESAPRAGQLALARATYRACRDGDSLLAEAPTGLGKTLAVLYGALRALPRAREERLWILTPRRTQRRAFIDAFQQRLPQALALRVVELPAEQSLCLAEGGVCLGPACPFGEAFHARSRPVLQALRAPRRGQRTAVLTGPKLRRLGARARLCPVALAQRLARDADVVLSDVNFAFDPLQKKTGLQAPGEGGALFLIDEAHQLHSRLRGMHRVELDVQSLQGALAESGSGPWQGPLKTLLGRLQALAPQGGTDAALLTAWQPLLSQLAQALGTVPFASPLRPVLGMLLRLERLRSLQEQHPDAFWLTTAPGQLTLALLSPGAVLGGLWPRGQGRVLFSATLAPLAEERRALGLPPGPQLRLPSPFSPQQQRTLLVSELDLRARHRERAWPRLGRFLTRWAASQQGHHLVVVPAFSVLEALVGELQTVAPDRLGPVQARAMTEDAQDRFLAALAQPSTCGRLALVVAGGRFTEGIDLPPGALSSVVMIGLPVPPPLEEREALAAQAEEGAFRAYQGQALRQALQAAGRLCRRPEDRGVVMFVDGRYGDVRFAELWPAHLTPKACTLEGALAQARAFWRAGEGLAA
ncbi:MAG: ATP-dependent DNA helicase [Pseudomonadales bacterium]|nr:ATP-dependent DNA helicase [Pseudomonadales bacterium]